MTDAPDNAVFSDALKLRSTYKFWVREQVRFNDLDALGHVNSIRTQEYFAGVRTALFQRVIGGWPQQAAQLPVMRLSVVQYEREIHFPADLDAGLVIERFGNTSVTLAEAVFANDDCLALHRSVLVFIDARTRQPAPPPEAVKQKFMALAG